MALLLDSASSADARQAAALGFVRGATTNPSLIAKAGRPAERVIHEFCELLPGKIFYQVTAQSLADRETEARQMVAMWPDRIGLKIPCTLENLGLAARLAKEGYTVGMTAIFSPAQVYLACQAGVQYVLPYVNRSTRLLGDGFALVSEMREVIEAGNHAVEIVAASIKGPEEAVQTLLAGAHHLTLPLAVVDAMGHHPLSDEAIAVFGEHTLLSSAEFAGETRP